MAKLRCNQHNPCSGKYGPCLDVKLTDVCNGSCHFCIEKGGYSPKGKGLSVRELAKKINEHPAESVLLLGGEPTLYSEIGRLIGELRGSKKIYMTTNGSYLHTVDIDRLSSLTAINISIHHFIESENVKILGIRGKEIPVFEEIKKIIQRIGSKVKVRINCNLIKGAIDSKEAVCSMVGFAKWLGAHELRLAELQGPIPSEEFASADNIFKDLPEEPFVGGCEHEFQVMGFPVKVRQVCGWVSENKPKPKTRAGHNPQTSVLYSNGVIAKGWKGRKGSEIGCHQEDKWFQLSIKNDGAWVRKGSPKIHFVKKQRTSTTHTSCHGREPGCH